MAPLMLAMGYTGASGETLAFGGALGARLRPGVIFCVNSNIVAEIEFTQIHRAWSSSAAAPIEIFAEVKGIGPGRLTS
jgi:hypothetical protein